MKINYKRLVSHQAGFTLIELMIGMVIGLLVALVIVQVLQIFETQKRTTTGTADAQTNGGIALYNIGRELQLAGFPLMPSGVPTAADSPLECTTVTYGATGITSISPVSITNNVAVAGVTAGSDSITLTYGTSGNGGIPRKIGSVAVNVITVDTNFGCAVGDITLIRNGGTCALSSVTAVTGTVDPMTVTVNDAASAAVDADFSCLGQWNTVTYAVDVNGNLTKSINGAAAQAVVAGVVNLQAQYGISASTNSNQIVQWVDPSGATWAAPTVANRNLIKAVRVAVVARNAKPETYDVSTACTQAVEPLPTSGVCAWRDVPKGDTVVPNTPITTASPAPVFSLTATPNWRRYHYKVFETVIPVRNIVWSKDTL